MARPSGPKTRCSGQWTEARFKSFIISALRGATKRWGPRNEAKKEANVRRGFYKCAECKEVVPLKVKRNGRMVTNIHIDHIVPMVDPAVGFTNWDEYIERMFCEKDGLQVLCRDCHDVKCSEERAIAVERRRQEKLNG